MIFDSAYFSGFGFVQVYSLGGGPAVVLGDSFYFTLRVRTRLGITSHIPAQQLNARSGVRTELDIRSEKEDA